MLVKPNIIPIFAEIDTLSHVMAGLVPAIHDFDMTHDFQTWMPATSAGMTG